LESKKSDHLFAKYVLNKMYLCRIINLAMSTDLTNNLISKISALLNEARNKVATAVNQTMVLTYFEIGRIIVEEEQNGKERAGYGKQLLKSISARLSSEFGRGFSEDNLGNMRKFYLVYSNQNTISETVSRNSENSQTASLEFKLSWSHYIKLMRIDDPNERKFYEIEAHKNNWSLRELQRQYDTALYTRLAISRNKDEVLALSTKGQIIETPKDSIKDPYILEFLGLP
jgi:predicted DNA-binding WGR domain protein